MAPLIPLVNPLSPTSLPIGPNLPTTHPPGKRPSIARTRPGVAAPTALVSQRPGQGRALAIRPTRPNARCGAQMTQDDSDAPLFAPAAVHRPDPSRARARAGSRPEPKPETLRAGRERTRAGPFGESARRSRRAIRSGAGCAGTVRGRPAAARRRRAPRQRARERAASAARAVHTADRHRRLGRARTGIVHRHECVVG